MPFIDSQFAFYLANFMEKNVDAVVPVDRDGRRHMVAALYHKRINCVVESQLQKGENRIINVLEKIRVRYVQIENHDMEKKLKNVNHPEESERLVEQGSWLLI